ncbi:N/A [soil metagenome]
MIIGAVAILTGCGVEDSTSIATSESLDAVTLLTQASDSLAETETLRFNLEIDGDTFVDEAGTIRLLAARGDLARPDRVDVEFQVELLGAQTVSIRMITIDDEAWTTNLLSGAWEPSPEEFGYNPTVLFDDQGGLGPVAGRLNSPQVLDAETIGGRETWPVQGTVDNDTISSLTSGTADGEVITVTLWVDQESSNVLQLQLTEPDDTDKENPAAWTMRLTGHNQDVTIERPDLAD